MKKEWIVGQWYRRLYSDNSFIRFYKIENCDSYDRIWYDEEIDKGVYIKHSIDDNNYWANDDYESHALRNPVDLKEIQVYLPSFHENKFIPIDDTSHEEILIKLLKDIL